MRLRLLCPLVLALVAASTAATAQSQPAATENPFSTRASRTVVVHFVPLDARAQRLLRATLRSIQRWLHYPYEITAVPTLRPAWLNRERRQLNSRAIMSYVLAFATLPPGC